MSLLNHYISHSYVAITGRWHKGSGLDSVWSARGAVLIWKCCLIRLDIPFPWDRLIFVMGILFQGIRPFYRDGALFRSVCKVTDHGVATGPHSDIGLHRKMYASGWQSFTIPAISENCVESLAYCNHKYKITRLVLRTMTQWLMKWSSPIMEWHNSQMQCYLLAY